MTQSVLITGEIREEISKICDIVTQEMRRSLAEGETVKDEKVKQKMAERTISQLSECLGFFVQRAVGDRLIERFDEVVRPQARKAGGKGESHGNYD